MEKNMEVNDQLQDQEIVKSRSTKAAAIAGGSLIAVIVIVGAFFLYLTNSQIYTDNADIEAPTVSIAATQGGTLQKMLVTNGQEIAADTPVAQVADQVLRSDQAGLIVDAEDNIGKTINPGEAVVTMIHPTDLRVVAHIDEDKGLSDVHVGQLVNFTVDAFGSQKFVGVVEEISATSRESGVVFNISDQREVRQFDVKIKYDVNQYSELKNGMSAKVTIFTK